MPYSLHHLYRYEFRFTSSDKEWKIEYYIAYQGSFYESLLILMVVILASKEGQNVQLFSLFLVSNHKQIIYLFSSKQQQAHGRKDQIEEILN